MVDVLTWVRCKVGRIPYADELRGMTIREMERSLRAKGYSRSKAKQFVYLHKSRLRADG
jgi:hypothetical protein